MSEELESAVAPAPAFQATILSVRELGKTYVSGDQALTVLADVTFKLSAGDTCAVVGASGSGKTTLLGLCAGLDEPSTGSVAINGLALERMGEDARARFRNEQVGFVFQNFQLIPTLSALENVMVPLELRLEQQARPRAAEWLDRVGLGDRLHHYPVQLSGGEQQRVALARAFVNEPAILFADEPTGNLDAETSERIEELLFDLNRESGTTLMLVSHDLELAARTRRIIQLKGGRVVDDAPPPGR
jgi:putative ABC transport system ATP-binding protein